MPTTGEFKEWPFMPSAARPLTKTAPLAVVARVGAAPKGDPTAATIGTGLGHEAVRQNRPGPCGSAEAAGAFSPTVPSTPTNNAVTATEQPTRRLAQIPPMSRLLLEFPSTCVGAGSANDKGRTDSTNGEISIARHGLRSAVAGGSFTSVEEFTHDVSRGTEHE